MHREKAEHHLQQELRAQLPGTQEELGCRIRANPARTDSHSCPLTFPLALLGTLIRRLECKRYHRCRCR